MFFLVNSAHTIDRSLDSAILNHLIKTQYKFFRKPEHV